MNVFFGSLLGIGFILFSNIFLYKKSIYNSLVYSLFFFNVNVFEVGGTLIKPFHILALFLTLELFFSEKLLLARETKRLVVFLLILVVSIFMPLFLEENIYVSPMSNSQAGFLDNLQLLKFSIFNLTQILFPIFGVLLFNIILIRSKDLGSFISTIKVINNVQTLLNINIILILGLKFLGLSIYYEQLMISAFGMKFRIIENYANLGGIAKFYSFVGEPGYTSTVLLFFICFSLSQIITNTFYKNKWQAYRNLVITIVMLLLQGSTTGYMGIVMLVIALSFWSIKYFSLSRQISIFFKLSMSTIFFLVVFISVLNIDVNELIQEQITKLNGDSGSGTLRLDSALFGLDIFFRSPWLGIGYGSHRTTSLLISLLTNIGIIGFGTFLYFNLTIFFKFLKIDYIVRTTPLHFVFMFLFLSFITLIPVYLIGKSTVVFMYGWYWFMLALMSSFVRLIKATTI